MEGKFVVKSSNKKFSLMALDQSQEHSNKFLKEESGAKGLYGKQEEKEIIELSFRNACSFAPNQTNNTEHPEASATE